jgi:hypothetical protein
MHNKVLTYLDNHTNFEPLKAPIMTFFLGSHDELPLFIDKKAILVIHFSFVCRPEFEFVSNTSKRTTQPVWFPFKLEHY